MILEVFRVVHRLSFSRTVIVALVAAVLAVGGAVAAQAQTAKGPSGLPLPRFVSLKSNEVNVRVGPGTDYAIKWTFKRQGWPVEVVQEFDNWRRIRDSDGAEGWVYHSLLSSDRTALVAPWRSDPVPLRAGPDDEARVVALLEPLVLARVESCDKRWCEISGKAWSGFISQKTLFGVYPNESFD
ncbi:SH3 domain-containing protein [Amorphus sp. 3PC139-8]|uniref:SH3 domain-containing protein n=1 Tax=Amorphus sp. 3PC139-8 TaxID=2735676 RepID=UPI00345D0C30